MSKTTSVYITQNFERNLDIIQEYLSENGAPQQFGRLIENLFDTIIPNLQRFPKIGVAFLERDPMSLEGLNIFESITKKLTGQDDLREYIFGDYLILYALIEDELFLLSIKHHSQLGFELGKR